MLKTTTNSLTTHLNNAGLEIEIQKNSEVIIIRYIGGSKLECLWGTDIVFLDFKEINTESLKIKEINMEKCLDGINWFFWFDEPITLEESYEFLAGFSSLQIKVDERNLLLESAERLGRILKNQEEYSLKWFAAILVLIQHKLCYAQKLSVKQGGEMLNHYFHLFL